MSQTSTINLGSQRQTIRGFGGMNFPRWIGDLTTDQADKAFGNGTGQIGLTILRIDVPPNSSDWSAELPTAQRAISHGAIVFATPWSPPASMKSNGSTTGGSLNSSSYSAYANHLRDFCNYMSSNGASLYAISVQNEPDYVPDYESCGWTSSQMRTFLDNNASVIPVRVIAPETVHPKSDWYNALSSASQLDIYGDHLYGGSPTSFSKEHWMTEHLVNNTDWAGALATGKEIHDCMVVNYSAYIWWYIRRSYGPIDENGNVTKRGYVMSQFSKFVRSGYTRVDATATPTSGVSVTAYTNGTTLVIVAINQNSSTRSVTFNLSGGQVGSFTKYETTSSANVANRGTVSGGSSMTNTLSASSITTYVGTIGGGEPGGNTSVWLEAECGTVGSLWNIVSDGSASHDQYVTIQSGNNSTGSAPSSSSGHISYSFNVGESGTYMLWGRVIAPSGNDDSFWVRMDNGSWFNWNNITSSSSWTWDDCQSYSLSAGSHTLTFAYREDGTRLDKILVTNTGTTPSGEGSAADNCTTTNQPPVANAGSDQTVTDTDNNGSQSVTLNGSGSSDPDGSITSYIWREGGSQIASGATPSVNLSVGTHTITLTVTDNGGATDTDDVIVTVNPGSGGGTDVWLEAECGTVGSLWNIVSDGNASHDQYVTIQSGNNSTGSAPSSTSGHITYSFNVSESGNYVVWGRVIAPSGNDDSFWVRMDNGSWFNWNNITPSSSWTWDDCQSYSLSTGNHTLTIAYREDGSRLDKILITNAGTTPSGEGSAADNCGGGTGDYTITVRARGTAGSEQIRLTVGGTAIQTWTLGTSLSNYNATTSNSGVINVEFINDDGTNRDVQVDYIIVAGSTWQAEDQSTNTGVWQDGSCGGSYSEWLHCNGYIGFNAYKSAEANEESITDVSNNTGINIYPNPASDKLFIELPRIDQNSIVIRIYTLAGVLIKNLEINKQNPVIDIGDMHSGYYFIKINHGNNCYTGKFYKL